MKKIHISLILFVFAGILFSSCSNSSRIAITKRHYRSGYYVDFGAKKPVQTVSKISPVNRHKTAQAITAKPVNQVAMNVTTEVTPAILQNSQTSTKLQTGNAKIIHSATADNDIAPTNGNNVNESPTLANKQTVLESSGDGDRGAERDALSLLWIVIVVILILWLIGIIAGGFGLGGLINLLLVIALILFILWLLRVW